MAMPLSKFLAARILSKSARGSGAPVSTCAVIGATHVPFPAEVLHELARQLDRVPFDALNARHAGDVDFGQQLVQPVAELVEQRHHLVVGERRGLARGALADRRREIAREIGDRMLHAGTDAAAVDGVVHPRAALLARPRIEVEIELADERAAARRVMSKKRTVGCQVGALASRIVDAVERFGDAEEARRARGPPGK